MPKGTRKGAQTPSTASEVTVRSYDRRMRDRFEEAQKAVGILIDVSNGRRASDEDEEARAVRVICQSFGRDIFADLRESARNASTVLHRLLGTYDLMTISYLTAADTDANKRYFTLMSCSNIGSQLWDLCAHLLSQVKQIQDIIETIEDVQDPSRAATRSKHDRTRASARGVDTAASSEHVRARSSTLVSRVSASVRRAAKVSKQANSAITLWKELDERNARPTTVQSACSMTEGWITDVLAREGGHRRPTFDSINRSLCLTANCIMRTMEWAHPIHHQGADYLRCEICGGQCNIVRAASEAICGKCGSIREIIGSATADALTGDDVESSDSASVGSRGTLEAQHPNRRGGWHYMRHLRIWLGRLQAIETFELAPSDIARLRESIMSEYTTIADINWRLLSCADVARHLDLCKLSHLVDHLPKLVKELGGRAPPILDCDSDQIIVRDFIHIMDIYSQLYHEPGNKPYYPFFIAKIIKRRFADNPEIYRILSYVSSQGYDTIKKNDHIYEEICKVAPKQYDLIYDPEIE